MFCVWQGRQIHRDVDLDRLWRFSPTFVMLITIHANSGALHPSC